MDLFADIAEETRLAALHRFGPLDRPPEPAYDALASIAARLFQVPAASISLVDREQVRFKAVVGGEAPAQLSRSICWCAKAVETRAPFIIPDRSETGSAAIGRPPCDAARFYAGVPLLTGDGHAIGALAVMDFVPRPHASLDVQPLVQVAEQVVARLELDALRREERPDVERLREAEGALLEALRSRDELFSIATHELKTPLTSLQLKIQFLQRHAARLETMPTRELIEHLKAAQRQIERLHRMIELMLDMARLRAGRLQLELQTYDLGESVCEVVGRLSDQARDVRCEIDLETAPVVGTWDRLRIEQVVENLLTNGFKYGAGMPIVVEVSGDSDRAFITVRDQGIGIARSDQDRIFRPFERGTSVSQHQSLGLGLYIAAEIVGAHGGRISVESAPGQGAQFTVELPRQPAQEEGAAVGG